MKKLIVVFLLLCSGVIYFIGSACSGDCDGKEEGPVLSGPSVEECACVTVPKADFTVLDNVNEYYVGQTVTYIFTGDKGNSTGIAKETFLQWNLPGTPDSVYIFLVETSVSVAYAYAGYYTVSLKAHNSCWSDRKTIYHYVQIKDWPTK